MTTPQKNPRSCKRRCLNFSIVLVLYLLFLLWVGSWWGLLVVPFIFDVYFTKKIKLGLVEKPQERHGPQHHGMG